MDVACGSAMKGIHPKSPNFYLVQKYTGDWTDALHICISAVELKSPRKSLASASLPCEKMAACRYHANRYLSGMCPNARRRQAAKRRSKGARRKDREAGCREATVGVRRRACTYAKRILYAQKGTSRFASGIICAII